MTINYCDKEDRYWIKDGDQTLTFASSLDAKQALREIELRQAVEVELALIAAYFRKAGLTQIAASIEAKDYKKDQKNA